MWGKIGVRLLNLGGHPSGSSAPGGAGAISI